MSKFLVLFWFFSRNCSTCSTARVEVPPIEPAIIDRNRVCSSLKLKETLVTRPTTNNILSVNVVPVIQKEFKSNELTHWFLPRNGLEDTRLILITNQCVVEINCHGKKSKAWAEQVRICIVTSSVCRHRGCLNYLSVETCVDGILRYYIDLARFFYHFWIKSIWANVKNQSEKK